MSDKKYHPLLDEIETINHNGKLYLNCDEANNAMWSIEQRKESFRSMSEVAAKNADRMVHEIDTIRGLCLVIARDLATHGSDDHKTKKEAILRAVARLLYIDSAYAEGGSGADEIPF